MVANRGSDSREYFKCTILQDKMRRCYEHNTFSHRPDRETEPRIRRIPSDRTICKSFGMTSSDSTSRNYQRRQGHGLRCTKDRQARAITLQETPVRSCSFFTHLNRDIRNLVYGYLSLPPFPNAKKHCRGLVFSCCQARIEIEEEAISKLRIFLILWRKWNV
jgi:hypothetical protein